MHMAPSTTTITTWTAGFVMRSVCKSKKLDAIDISKIHLETSHIMELNGLTQTRLCGSAAGHHGGPQCGMDRPSQPLDVRLKHKSV
eukprot:3818235-Karenia_brevis.AAC.1